MSSTKLSSGSTDAAAAEQFNSSATAALTAADSTSADRVQNLSLVHQARVTRLTRTANSMVTQYGKTSPQADAAQAAVATAQTTAGRIEFVHQQLATPAPTVAATGWALQGRVYNSQLQPVTGYTVFLVDGRKNYQSACGFAYTDSTGYFLLSFPGASQASASAAPSTPAPSTPAAAPVPDAAAFRASAPPSTQPAAPAASAAVSLFVEIANTKAQPVYLSSIAFQPIIGSATYQNITLPAGEPELGDPPAAIRAVALPPPKTSA